MGKYMRKAKISADVAVMDVSSLGVRTRAKTLALKRQQQSSTSVTSPAAAPPSPAKSYSCYLELRSRRLEKPSLDHHLNKNPQREVDPESDSRGKTNSSSNSRLGVNSVDSGSDGSDSISKEKASVDSPAIGRGTEEVAGLGVEAVVGENNLERSTRESTPSNLIRDAVAILTPGSATWQAAALRAGTRGTQNAGHVVVPISEFEDLFEVREQEQQRRFMEKYNFDVVNDVPLPGPYEWVKVTP